MNEPGECRCKTPRPRRLAANEIDWLCSQCGYLVRRLWVDKWMADLMRYRAQGRKPKNV